RFRQHSRQPSRSANLGLLDTPHRPRPHRHPHRPRSTFLPASPVLRRLRVRPHASPRHTTAASASATKHRAATIAGSEAVLNSYLVIPAERPLRIVIPGGSGQVGRVLARHFSQRGHHVIVLTRGPHTAEWQTVHWDAQTPGIWTQYLEGADVCINLAGRSVNCRYTPDNRIDIYNSRIFSTQLLGKVIGSLANPPRVWL